jgi:hypothetical protein
MFYRPPAAEEPSPHPDKAALEIEKLRLEIKYARRTFVLQSTNSLALIVMALLVFYFFQRPQIDILESNRATSEKQQVATLLIAAQNIAKAEDKRRVIQVLVSQWPQHAFLKEVAKSDIVVAESKEEVKTVPPIPSATPPTPSNHDPERLKDCASLRRHLAELDASTAALRELKLSETQGLGTRRQAGFGPIARTIEDQLDRVTEETHRVRNVMSFLACR